MGVVVRATHLQLGEAVAIKVLREGSLDDDARLRFLREARAAGKLRSEHVARVMDVGTLENGEPYMVMEYLEGTDLAAILDRRGRLPLGQACDYLLQACLGLAEAHRHGIVHRDLKPANLYLCERSDGTPLLKLLDFGVSKRTLEDEVRITQTQAFLGTPAYMSPEQMRAATSVDARTDLWSLGVMLYELVEGRRPFAGDNLVELVMKVTSEPIPPLTVAHPPGLVPVITRCLAKEPADRYPTVTALAADLAPFAQDPAAAGRIVAQIARILGRDATPVPSSVAAVPPPTSRTIPSRIVVVVGSALAVLGIAVAVAVVTRDAPAVSRGDGSARTVDVPVEATQAVDARVTSIADGAVDAIGLIPDAGAAKNQHPKTPENPAPSVPRGSDLFDTYQFGKKK
ncbi:MAG: protein kinase [Proteobacteria bacterium]|nr:protein kinase [Pseudomonadota bacterium]